MTETTTLPVAIPEDVLRYCESWGLTHDLQTAIKTAEAAYAPVRGWQIGMELDPDIDDEYVVIDISIDEDLEEILRKHRSYIHQWSQVASPEGTWRIRVLWNVA